VNFEADWTSAGARLGFGFGGVLGLGRFFLGVGEVGETDVCEVFERGLVSLCDRETDVVAERCQQEFWDRAGRSRGGRRGDFG
jgi:hypothetical protein